MSERRTAYLLLLAMAVCFGGTWPAGKLAVEDVTGGVAILAGLWLVQKPSVKPETAPAGQQLAAD